MSENRDEYNRGGMLAFAFCMVFCLAFFIYLVAINKGVDLAENVVDPNAPAAEGAAPAFDITKVAEPWVSTPEMVTYGKKVFMTNCAMCHGNEGKGDGAAGAALNPKPRNLVEGKWTQGEGVIAHYNVLLNGIKGSSMASYAHFKPADRWAVIHYIDSITNNKSKDDPAKVAEFAKTAK
ncbi:c-type cytochrome [Bdellovibrio sp. HCB2-146]|uniref:c-type cytochrome n=1 Tax=Bdellovibrio sp. HCB2-146 TaxID=3394362 RepID=UPI0039BCDEEA